MRALRLLPLWALAALLSLPVLALLGAWLPWGQTDAQAWPILREMAATVLPGYVHTTLWLALWVGLGAALVGMCTAAAVTLFDFPGRRQMDWLLLLLIAGLNTALAFWIWNHTLQSLTAMESSMINNSMLIQITLLAWIFLGESVSLIGAIGLVIAVVGLFLVNWQPAKRPA